MNWEKLVINKTTAPFGIESSGNIVYLKVKLNNDDINHQFIKDRLEYIEKEECKLMGNLKLVSNIRELKDGNCILRIRIKSYKGRKTVKMNYSKNCFKEDYLKSIDDLTLDAEIGVKFSIGNGYTFQSDGETKFGLGINVDEITIL